MKYFCFDFRLTLTITIISGQPHLRSCKCPYGICVKNIRFGTFVTIALINNNNIYIFAHLTAISMYANVVFIPWKYMSP